MSTASTPWQLVPSGVRVPPYSRLPESYSIMEGSVTGIGARWSLSALVQSPLFEMGQYGCVYGGYMASSGTLYVWCAKKGGVLDPSSAKLLVKVPSSSFCTIGVNCLDSISGEGCGSRASGLLLYCWWLSPFQLRCWVSAGVRGRGQDDKAFRLSRTSSRLLSFLPRWGQLSCLSTDK